MRAISIPIRDETILSLNVGEPLALSGIMITGRDTVHKWLIETFIKKTRAPQGEDLQIYEALKADPGGRRDLSLRTGRLGAGHKAV